MNSNFSYKKAGVDLDKSDLIKDKLFYIFSFSKNKKTSYNFNPSILGEKFDFLKKK